MLRRKTSLSGSEFQNSGACFSPREMITLTTTLMPEGGMHFLELPQLLTFLSTYLLLVFNVEGTGTWRSDCGGQHRVGSEGSHTVYRKESFRSQKAAWEDCVGWDASCRVRDQCSPPVLRLGWMTGSWAGTQTRDRAGKSLCGLVGFRLC